MTIAVDADAAVVMGDAALLRRLLANLIDNAVLHTPPGTHILVRVGSDRETAALHVADDGPGVPADEHENIFGRFVRLDASRSTPGHGLGLNLVAAIAAAHHGAARAVPGAKGLAIEVTLPAVPGSTPSSPAHLRTRAGIETCVHEDRSQ